MSNFHAADSNFFLLIPKELFRAVFQEREIAIAEGRTPPPLIGTAGCPVDIRPLNMDDVRRAHEQVQVSIK